MRGETHLGIKQPSRPRVVQTPRGFTPHTEPWREERRPHVARHGRGEVHGGREPVEVGGPDGRGRTSRKHGRHCCGCRDVLRGWEGERGRVESRGYKQNNNYTTYTHVVQIMKKILLEVFKLQNNCALI